MGTNTLINCTFYLNEATGGTGGASGDQAGRGAPPEEGRRHCHSGEARTGDERTRVVLLAGAGKLDACLLRPRREVPAQVEGLRRGD
jgi:hypothetical protein